MKILFFGTPQLAVPFLDRLHRFHEIVGVVCRPDEPVGRGYKLTSPPVKVFARQKGLRVFQPEGKWTDRSVRPLQELNADLGISVAYGRLMPKAVFEAARLGTINVHFSVLPKYRGAGPMQWSLINGDKESGVSLFWVEDGLDSGPLFRQRAVPIDPLDDALTLKDKLVECGLTLLDSVLADVQAGKLIKEPQQGEPSVAPLLKKEDGRLKWNRSAKELANLIRGVREWPVAYTFYKDAHGRLKKLQVIQAAAEGTGKTDRPPGTILGVRKGGDVGVQTGKGALFLKTVRPDGKKDMAAESFWNGARLKTGERFE